MLHDDLRYETSTTFLKSYIWVVHICVQCNLIISIHIIFIQFPKISFSIFFEVETWGFFESWMDGVLLRQTHEGKFSWSRHRWKDVLLNKHIKGWCVMRDSSLMKCVCWSALRFVVRLCWDSMGRNSLENFWWCPLASYHFWGFQLMVTVISAEGDSCWDKKHAVARPIDMWCLKEL